MKKANERTRWNELSRLDDQNFPAATVLKAQKYCEDYPDSAIAWLILGRNLVAIAKYKAAERALKRGVNLLPTEHRHLGFGELGHLFRAAGNYLEASNWFRHAIKTAPNLSAYYIYLGAVLAKSGQLREAEKAHRQAVKSCEGCIDEAHLNLGLVLRARGQFPEALKCFREAIRISPEYHDAKEAIKDVMKCLEIEKRSECR